MNLATQMRLMARNNAWSNGRLLDACARLSRADFIAPRISFFPSLHATLNHILAIDSYYIDAIAEGGRGPAAFREYKAFDDVASLAEAQRESDRRLIAICDAATPESLQAIVVTDRGELGQFEEIRANLLLHLFTHQIHHRGQAHAMLSGANVKPPQLDEYFLAVDRDARAADLATHGVEGPEAIR